jgi:hypothetical protein
MEKRSERPHVSWQVLVEHARLIGVDAMTAHERGYGLQANQGCQKTVVVADVFQIELAWAHRIAVIVNPDAREWESLSLLTGANMATSDSVG